MVKIIRRRFLAAVAAFVPLLAFRRGVARPVVLPEPLPPVPVARGWFIDRNGWAYSPSVGWVHSMTPWKDLTPANWYGPPPPRPPRIRLDWGKIGTGLASGGPP